METINLLTDKIMVKSPYNILFNLKEETDGSISAQVNHEFTLPTECGPISASEAGRHLAILGSIALSMKSEKPSYYLAINANIKRETKTFKVSKTFTLNTRVTVQNNRKGSVAGEIFDEEKELIYSIKVDYQVITPQLFSKIFKPYLNEFPIENTASPYKYRKGLSCISVREDAVNAEYGPVVPSECEGHFKNYPALPVAVICNLFAELGSSLLFHHFPSEYAKFITTEATIQANRLVFAGEKLTFSGQTLKKLSNQSMVISSAAYVDEQKVAGAKFVMQAINERDDKILVHESEIEKEKHLEI